MIALLPRVALTASLVAGLSACSAEDDDCTEFASTEQTIGITHSAGLAPDGDDVRQATDEDPLLLGELVAGGGDGSASSTVAVYQSGSPSPDEIGWFTSSAIGREAERRGPAALAMEPYPTTEVSIDGMAAYRSELATDDGAVYTAWVIPGEEHSLDIVLRQGEDALAEENLADDLPDLISAGGCE